jgi:hypothetical protein
MTGQELYDFTTELLGGNALNEVLFYQLLNAARTRRESTRDWFPLRAKDTSISWLTTDSASVAKTLPSDFARPLRPTARTTPIVFLDPATGRKVGTATEVAIENQYDFAGTPGHFFIDYSAATPTLHFTGAAPSAQTAALFYIKKGTDIAEATSWDGFSRTGRDFSPLLAYDVANMHKGGIDFDEINARMVQYASVDAEALAAAMLMDDERKRLAVLNV